MAESTSSICDNFNEEEQVESNLLARYEQQEFTYYPLDEKPLHVTIKSATSTVGDNLTDDDRDRTGLMIWPATHLLCQWLSGCPDELSLSTLESAGGAVLELGCGCGLVGVVAAKATSHRRVWVSTDMDEKALELARLNLDLNSISSDNVSWTRRLKWGEGDQIQGLQDDLEKAEQNSRQFASVVAADIVYPSTANQVLQLLLATVDTLLVDGGIFYLSFCTRDGYRTPQRLVEAASQAGFSIHALPPIHDDIKRKLPPLLDAKILVLKRDINARIINDRLGTLDCKAFPGLNAAIQRAAEESSDEEWAAPAFVDGDSDESDDEEFRKKLLASNGPF